MKKHICILTLAALAFACTPAANETQEEEIYAGNQAKVTFSSADPIPAEGGSVNVTVSTTLDFSYSLPATAKWLTVSQKDSVLTFTAPANPNATARYAGVALIDKAKDIVFARFDVNQAGTEVQEEIVYKAFAVSATTIKAKAEDTSASFDVTSEVAWTVTSDNAAFTVSPASGSNNGTVTVSFPANTDKENEVTANITVATTDADVAVKSFVVAITQEKAPESSGDGMPDKAAAAGVVAEWEFSEANLEFFNQTFAFEDAKVNGAPNPEANKVGYLNDEHYCPSNIVPGGKIRFYNGVDKTDLNPKGRCKRGTGNSGEPCWYGNWKGDHIDISVEPDGYVAAGKTVHITMVLRPNTQNTLKYWLIEIKDGDNWEPLGEVKTASVNGEDVKYNIELKFDPNGSNEVTGEGETAVYPDNPQQFNTFIEEDHVMKNKTWPIEYRITCQSLLISDGSMVVSYIGETSASKDQNPVLRIPGKNTTNGGAKPCGKNMLVEIK